MPHSYPREIINLSTLRLSIIGLWLRVGVLSLLFLLDEDFRFTRIR
jgi:hypothetical protein